MPNKKAAPPDGPTNRQVNDATSFLDPQVRPDGKRLETRVEVDPATIEEIVGSLPVLPTGRSEILQKYSSISPEIIVARGYRYIDGQHLSLLKRLGFSEKHGPGLLIPIRGISGEIVSCQARFDSPVETIDPKTGKKKKLRYLSPLGLDQRVDFPPGAPPDEVEVWFTEGAKKADALRSRGVYALCLTGVWNWSGKQARKDIESLDWRGRTALICFDSDTETKPAVKKAETKLAAFLRELGADPKIIRLEPAPDGEKIGVDDFFFKGGTLEELSGKIQEPEPDWISQLIRSETTGALKVNSANLTLILQHDERFRDAGNVRYDEFLNVLLFGNKPVSDPLITEICAEIELAWKMGAIPPAMLLGVLAMLGHRNKFHPVRDWLCSLKWDGRHRVDGLFSGYFGAKDSEYSRAVSRNFLIGAVARIMNPGCKNDLVPILRGPQGIFKSTGLAILFGEEWTGSPNAPWDSKDFLSFLHSGLWLIELEELAGMRRGEVEHVKKILTARSDRFRPPYGRVQEDFPRQCVFAGTTNADEFLKDPTGNRRFLPLKVTSVDTEGLKKDRGQIFAEAFSRFQRGEPWHLVPWEEAESEREAVFEADSWEEQVIPWLSERSPQQATISEILGKCLGIEVGRQTRADQTRAGAILRRLGWRPRRAGSGAGRVRIYEPGQPDGENGGWTRLSKVGPSLASTGYVQPVQPDLPLNTIYRGKERDAITHAHDIPIYGSVENGVGRWPGWTEPAPEPFSGVQPPSRVGQPLDQDIPVEDI